MLVALIVIKSGVIRVRVVKLFNESYKMYACMYALCAYLNVCICVCACAYICICLYLYVSLTHVNYTS